MSCPSAGSITLARASLTLASFMRLRLGNVPELGLLCREVAVAVGRRVDPVRFVSGDDDACAFEAGDLLRVVRHQADARDAEVGEDPCREVIRSKVGVE